MDFRSAKIIDGLPLVTIGVLSYNYSQYIEEALNSLLAQTYPFIELIIIDDSSTEKSTPQKIRNWIHWNKLHCTYIQNEKNLGITKVSNLLVKMANGKYINLFATDDIMLPEKIERQVNILEHAGEEYGMCYANVKLIDEEGQELGLCNPGMQIFEDNVLKEYVFGNLPFATPGSLIRTSVYERIGLYDERVLIEDYNFWLRLTACFKVKYCGYPCLAYRIKKHSSIHAQLNSNNRERYYRDRILSNQQALKFIKDPEVKQRLEMKIKQYLKSLAANKASSLNEVLLFLLRKGYFFLSIKIFLMRLFSSRRNIKYGDVIV